MPSLLISSLSLQCKYVLLKYEKLAYNKIKQQEAVFPRNGQENLLDPGKLNQHKDE